MNKIIPTRLIFFIAYLLTGFTAIFSEASFASTDEALITYPKIGGHYNFVLPLATFGNGSQAIGTDYVKLGLAPGVTARLDQNWIVDFEFVAYNDFKSGGRTSLVVDPGILYNLGPAVAGLRLAVDVDAVQNWGFIPIVVKTFPAGIFSWLIELDLPIFLRPGNTSITIQPQFGIAF